MTTPRPIPLRHGARLGVFALMAVVLTACPSPRMNFSLVEAPLQAQLGQELLAEVGSTGGTTEAITEMGWYELFYGNDVQGARGYFDQALEAAPASAWSLQLGAALAATMEEDMEHAAASWLAVVTSAPEPLSTMAAFELDAIATTNPLALTPLASALATTLESRRLSTLALSALAPHAGIEVIAPTVWQVSSRLSAYPNVALTFAFEGEDSVDAAAFQDSLDKPPSVVAFEGGEVRLHGFKRGLYLLGAEVAVPASGSYLVVTTCTNPMVVRVDGGAPLACGSVDMVTPPMAIGEVDLTTGTHFVVAKVGLHASPGTLHVELVPVPVPTAAAGPLPEGGPVPAFLRDWASAKVAIAIGELGKAAGLIAGMPEPAVDTNLVRFLAASYLMAEATELGGGSGSLDKARSLLEQAVADDPGFIQAKSSLATVIKQTMSSTAALKKLEALTTGHEESSTWYLVLADIFQGLGWDKEASLAVDKALELSMGNPVVAKKHLSFSWSTVLATGDLATIEAHDPDALFKYYVQKGMIDEALAAAPPLEPFALDELYTYQLVAGLAGMSGHPKLAADIYDALEALPIDGAEPTFSLYEVATLQGDQAAAKGYVDTLMATPAAYNDTYLQLAYLGVNRFWEPFVQPLELPHSPPPGASGAAILLDETIKELFLDGSSLTYGHQVIVLYDKSALEAYGEISVPDNAEVINLRTIKQSGEVFEPEEILHKTSISLPNLEVGDIVELEYLFPDVAAPDDLLGSKRFFLAGINMPIERACATLLVPEGATFTIEEAFGDVTVDKTTGTFAGSAFQSTQWCTSHMPPWLLEPLAFLPLDTLPHVRLSVLPSWDELSWILADRLIPLTKLDADLVAVAKKVTKGAKTPRAKVEALHSYVMTTIAETSTSAFTIPARTTLEAEAGDRLVLLYTLLRAVGIVPQVVFVNPMSRDHQIPTTPDIEEYSYAVLQVPVGKGKEVWLDPAFDFGLFDYLPPIIQGRPCFAVDPVGGLEVTTTPSLPLEDELWKVDVTLQGKQEGSGLVFEGTLVSKVSGIRGIFFRNVLASLEEEKLPVAMATFLHNVFPEAMLTDASVDHLDEPDEPLTISLDFVVPLDGETLQVSFVPEGFRKNYVKVSTRTYSMFVNLLMNLVFDLKVTFPASYEVVSPLAPKKVEEGEVRASIVFGEPTTAKGKTSLGVTKRLVFQPTIVEPSEYLQFVQLCDALDAIDYVTLELVQKTK